MNLLGNCLATAVVARWEGIQYPTEGTLETETLDTVDILAGTKS